ncbi:helix-turn-helix domain-containing protein [Streptosporangium nondiastaticum]|uniref:helix-turn-helix domain-containing protein n=1 Tax=Streptosporangium nondiastaticum TaxID=35764 RepID=UPI001CB8A731|nr:helix-turn-helix domain-containing protein [Streptosporangium nondiastaticum]
MSPAGRADFDAVVEGVEAGLAGSGVEEQLAGLCLADGLAGQEEATVRLLAEGRTDEAIAKRLGVSRRTARRIATGLMERLGARSRFQVGVLAVQAGWLPTRAAH